MILRSFTQNSPLLPIFYPLVVILIVVLGRQELWLNAQNSAIYGMGPVMLISGFILLICFNALLINLIYNRSELFHSPVYLTGLIYCILISVTAVQTGNITSLIAQTTFLIALYFALSIFRQKKIAHYLFIAALFMGLSSLLDDFNTSFIILLLFLAIWNRPLSYKDIVLVFLGFITPLLYWFFWCWFYQSDIDFFLWSSNIFFQNQWSHHPSLTLILTLFFSLTLAALSLSHKEDRQSNKTGQSKQYILILFTIAIIALATQYFTKHHLKTQNVVSVAPILLLSHYWTHYRTSLLSPFVFYIFLIVLMIQYFHWF